ncbi:hypothetical protein FGO68_gene8167 [Halteria grandinella]|uniref:Uncharacterized protein n=1 Tax=Halteria grandinella TaxID=5974 RepID=A0A8J8T5H7_HALGN|nr:hypothetical protein FGO68_gene8167 [Halteria grandinella]
MKVKILRDRFVRVANILKATTSTHSSRGELLRSLCCLYCFNFLLQLIVSLFELDILSHNMTRNLLFNPSNLMNREYFQLFSNGRWQLSEGPLELSHVGYRLEQQPSIYISVLQQCFIFKASVNIFIAQPLDPLLNTYLFYPPFM